MTQAVTNVTVTVLTPVTVSTLGSRCPTGNRFVVFRPGRRHGVVGQSRATPSPSLFN